MPPISFNEIPPTQRVPLVYIEFDSSRAVRGTPAIQHRLLVIGQRLATGTVLAGVPTLVTSAAQAEKAFGRGSMLAEMFAILKQGNRYTESWAIALDEAGAGVAATGSLAFSGAVTAPGTLNLYIAGKKVRVGISTGQAMTSIATAVAAAIAADTSLPVTAVASTSNVNLTARWKGETGNNIDLRTNYYQGEELPAGLAVVITAMANGTTNPDITAAVTVMNDDWYHSIVMPYTDAANLTVLEAELLSRWQAPRMIDGVAYTAFRGTVGNTQTFGNGRNSKHVSCISTAIAPQPPYIWSSAYAGAAAASLAIDPARPLQTLVLTGIMPPAINDRQDLAEQNILLGDGVATHYVDAGGLVRIQREVTMYQVNAFNSPDPSYLDVTTPMTLSYLRYSTRARITTKFPRHKLADDGTKFGAGQAIVTPSIIRGELITLFREWEAAGLVEGFEQFKADLVVERDENDRNRLNVLTSPDIVNQLRVYAQSTQFIV